MTFRFALFQTAISVGWCVNERYLNPPPAWSPYIITRFLMTWQDLIGFIALHFKVLKIHVCYYKHSWLPCASLEYLNAVHICPIHANTDWLIFFIYLFSRNLWEKPDPLCAGFHNTLSGSDHLLYFSLQHMHEGRWSHFSKNIFVSVWDNIELVFTTALSSCFSFQVIYVGCAYATVYLIYVKFKATYDGNHDTFRVEFLVVPVGGLAFLVNHDFSPLEVCCM